MTKRLARISAAAAAAVVGLSVGVARADNSSTEPSKQDLLQQIQALQAKVEAQDARQHELEQRLNKQSSEQADLQRRQAETDVAAVHSDAQKHSAMLDMEGFTAGYSNGKFVIQSGNGSFMWHPWIQMQFREVLNYRDRSGAASGDTENGLEINRLRFGFDGNLFSPDFAYFFNWGTYPANTTTTKSGTTTTTVTNGVGGAPVLEEAWVKYHIQNTPWLIKAGQIRDPLAHEELVGPNVQVTAERSLQNAVFSNTDGFTDAVTFIYDHGGNYRAEGGINHGLRSANTNFEDYPTNGNAYDWGIAARAEYKFMGKWKDYDQLTAYGDASELLVAGAGFDYSEGGRDAQFTHALDVQYASPSGLFLYGSYMGRYTSHNEGIPTGGTVGTTFGTTGIVGKSTYEPSLLLQGSYAVDAHWEPFLRYEYMMLAGTPVGSGNNVQEISAGTCYWFHGHNAKFSAQVMYLPNGSPISESNNDVLIDNKHSEFVFTAQFQLLL